VACHGLSVNAKLLEMQGLQSVQGATVLAMDQLPHEQEVTETVDTDAPTRAKIHDLLRDVEEQHGGRRIRRLELEQRSDHVAVYATFLSHLRDEPAA
jgi:hypothetical protein